MEIKINKKFFICTSIVVLLCFASFCAGRFIRFRGVSGTSQQLVNGIVLEGEAIDRITDGLNLERGSIKSAADLGRAVEKGLEASRRSNEVGRICTDAIKQSIEDDKKFLEDLRGDVSEYFDSTDYALDVAIKRAELYESIVSTYEQAYRNNGENSEESK